MIPQFDNHQRVLVTGGAGFIGGAVIRRLLKETNTLIFNLDKIGYASDVESLQQVLFSLNDTNSSDRYQHLKVDLSDSKATLEAINYADPDLIMHLAAESHVDRSIDGPDVFLESNVLGTFNLLQASKAHWQNLKSERKNNFRFHHISTDEVYGSLGDNGRFCETTPYDPRSPYSASKACSDHLVSSWHHTYGLPVVITNCSNNYGPWQFPEKLIPVVILKAISGKSIPVYGDGKNIRDWLYVEDHVDALFLAALQGQLGKHYCIGGHGEKSNIDVILSICSLLDTLRPASRPYSNLIENVRDRPGHDRRYSINSDLISNELHWLPSNTFDQGLYKTVSWYLENIQWCSKMQDRAGYKGERLGVI